MGYTPIYDVKIIHPIYRKFLMLNKIKNVFIFLFFFIVSCIKFLINTLFSILRLNDAIPDDLDYGESRGNLIEEMRIDNEYIKNHPAEKPPTGEFATTPYDNYDELRSALIDIIPEFTVKLKVDSRTNRLEFSTDINSVFDIAWLTLARMLSKDPAPEDKGKSDNRPEGIMIRCRNCGKFIIRKSNRQEFCDAEECQKVRNARKQKAYRERKAIVKAQKIKKKAHLFI